MQRSRKALLKRRAALEIADSGRKKLYTISVVLISWGVFFLLSCRFSRGNSYMEDPINGRMTEFKLSNQSVYVQIGGLGGDKDKRFVREGHENTETLVEKKQVLDEVSHVEVKEERINPPSSEKASRVAPSLDEFRSRSFIGKEKKGTGQANSVINRIEPDGKEYNYASASKGAKVLASNKEAKDVTSILGKNKDKYLRNPCSAEDKHIVIELSEETLVDTLQIANFEHYSSNVKEFELLSSLVYPTDSWIRIGNFTAANVKHAQRFVLEEPKWAIYLKLNLLSHYGSEFYCTLSAFEVYGVDAVEKMLEDLISDQDSHFSSEEAIVDEPLSPSTTDGDHIYHEILPEAHAELVETKDGKQELSESRPNQVGRMPGDTVLKTLMQKVHSLDVNCAVLERYSEELNGRYEKIFTDIDDEIARKDLALEQTGHEIKNLRSSQHESDKLIEELLAWKSMVSLQVTGLAEDNAALRLEVRRIWTNQARLENQGLVVILLSFVFGCFAAMKLLLDLFLGVYRIHKPKFFGGVNHSWFVLLVSSSIVICILIL